MGLSVDDDEAARAPKPADADPNTEPLVDPNTGAADGSEDLCGDSSAAGDLAASLAAPKVVAVTPKADPKVVELGGAAPPNENPPDFTGEVLLDAVFVKLNEAACIPDIRFDDIDFAAAGVSSSVSTSLSIELIDETESSSSL